MSQHHGPDKANRVFAPAARPEPPRRRRASASLQGCGSAGWVTAGWTGLADFSSRFLSRLRVRASSSSMRAEDGFAIDKEGQVPEVYTERQATSEFEKDLWKRFWELANDEKQIGR